MALFSDIIKTEAIRIRNNKTAGEQFVSVSGFGRLVSSTRATFLKVGLILDEAVYIDTPPCYCNTKLPMCLHTAMCRLRFAGSRQCDVCGCMEALGAESVNKLSKINA